MTTQIQFGVAESFRGTDPESGCCEVALSSATVSFIGRGQVGQFPNAWHYQAETLNPAETRREIETAGGVLL